MFKMPERVYEDCQIRPERTTVKNHERIMLTQPIGGCLFRQYVPKLIRARSRFEGVCTPRNEGNRRLRSKRCVRATSAIEKYVETWGRKIKTSPTWREREDGGYMFPSCT